MGIPIKSVVIEGTDLSGKTSLYGAIHKRTGFKHNIQDRSCLSMLCYARLYGRPDEPHRRGLNKELCDLNNFIVVLLLPRDEILRRLSLRGDEFQDAVSLMRLYDIFVEEVQKIQGAPNVLVVSDVLALDDLARLVVGRLETYETAPPLEAGRMLPQLLSSLSVNEAQVHLEMVLDPMYRDHSVLSDPRETHYYNGIIESCAKVIRKELEGDNPYGKPQDLSSRRFFYHSDTCISTVHFLPRDGDVRVLCGLRSTDVDRNGEIDTRFLSHLACLIPRTFEWPASRIFVSLFFNSAHIRTDIVG